MPLAAEDAQTVRNGGYTGACSPGMVTIRDSLAEFLRPGPVFSVGCRHQVAKLRTWKRAGARSWPWIFSHLQMEGYRTLTAGQAVEFEYMPGRGQDGCDHRALWVRPVEA